MSGKFVTWLMGDIDLREVQDKAQKEAWADTLKRPSPELSKLIFDVEMQAYKESLESYRNAVKQFDGLLIFGGAVVAWLTTLIAKLPGSEARYFAIAAVAVTALGLIAAVLGRRAVNRPTLIDAVEALRAAQNQSEPALLDWYTRELYVSRITFKLVSDQHAWRLTVSTWLVALGLLLSGIAVAIQP